MTKNLTLTQITKHFESRVAYLSSPPQKWDLEQVLKYIERDDYNQLLFDYGERYCLIVLDLFEQVEWYETCAEVVKQIETHNMVANTNFKTSLRDL